MGLCVFVYVHTIGKMGAVFVSPSRL